MDRAKSNEVSRPRRARHTYEQKSKGRKAARIQEADCEQQIAQVVFQKQSDRKRNSLKRYRQIESCAQGAI